MYTLDNTVLLVIDIQGKLATMMHESDALFSSVSTLIQGMKAMDVPIVWMEQLPDKLGSSISQVSDLLTPDIEPISKHTFSCCKNSQFMDRFNAINRKQVLLAGIESHICVYQTGVDLLDQGCEVQMVADCVSSRTPENRQLGIDRICQAGGGVTSVEMIFFELLQKAEGDLFRQVVKLIK
ncbi:Nicotinamidase-related amidase [Desulfocicer vacuolatum DSM 3385]|uniref:Nicotinamidase-related amidase n=1 Tax=Desulfocicer vacuolatum DSM 3385 TaxID=1121400 RepID=A0A1W2B8H0_9BACT|nr:isochorismatase family protein [Desulfocicer vacuolatum]SMC68982.1 Nicotinamidase-related amidase [Desulfocicer vacuolatum DSM 3385]